MAKQQTLGEDFRSDAARFRKCSEPHESVKAAHEAMQAFADDLAEIRVKHRIRNFVSVYDAALLEEDGTETATCAISAFGNQNSFESLAATLYGTEKAKREELIRKLIACGK